MKKKKLFAAIVFALSIIPFMGWCQTNEYDHRLKSLTELENQPEILEFIDSLRCEYIYTSDLAWLYASTLYQAGRLDQARDSLLLWESDSLYSTRARNMLTQIAIQQRNYMEAAKYLVRLSQHYPDNPVYPLRLARVFNAMNQLSGAEAQYIKAHSLDTLNQIVISEWVDVLIKLDFLPKARRILDKGLEVSSDNLGFRRQKATLDYRAKNYDEVINNVEFLTQRGDTTPQIIKLKAFALYHKDSLDRAEYWIDYLIDNGFIGEDIYFYKGHLLVARQQKNEAQNYYHMAAISCLSPNFNAFALQSGINMYELGQYQESIRWFQMLRQFSQNPIILFYLALNFNDYYEDTNPALTHFRIFLEQSTREDQESHREFALQKINEITHKNHFRGIN
jgi:tetratricopeptide (TPR) repeat protein